MILRSAQTNDPVWWREGDYRPAFERMAREGVHGVVVTEQIENWTYRRFIIALAKEFRLPAIFPAHVLLNLAAS